MSKEAGIRFNQEHNHACQRFGMDTRDHESLCYCERLLHRWHEAERIGTIRRDEPTGIPWTYAPDQDGMPLYRSREPLRVNASESISTAQKIAAKYHLCVHVDSDPDGCALYVCRAGDLAGREIQECYLSCGVAIEFPRGL
ncbi:MAG: hypothetical protein ACKO0M_02010 [Cyanobium sp.]